MYFGSVRFYRHLILIVMALIVICSIGSCIYLGFSNHHLKKLIKENGLTIEELENALDTPASTTLDLMKQRERMAQYYLSSFTYQDLYPELYVDNDYVFTEEASKTVYLTFDDGPSPLTSRVLDVLKTKDIKATFFVVYDDSPSAVALYKRMISEGHTIGVHSTSHQYEEIYESVETFLDDFAKTALMLEEVTGVKPEIFRFPGGSINNYNKHVHQPIVAEMVRRGYTYYDWNVSSGDASGNSSRPKIYSNVINNVQRFDRSIVLMHDASSKADTIASLPLIVDKLQAMGYTFSPLTQEVKPIAFEYVN